MDEFLTVEQVAAYLQLPKSTVYHYAQQKILPATRIGTRWRFRREHLEEWLGQERSRARATPRILVIDDDTEIRRVFTIALQEAGYEVVSVGAGREGIDRALRETFDLIFLDLLLPDQDGAEVLATLRPTYGVERIVVITAYSESEVLQRVLEMGVALVLAKPVRMPTLQQVARDLLRQLEPAAAQA